VRQCGDRQPAPHREAELLVQVDRVRVRRENVKERTFGATSMPAMIVPSRREIENERC
jgi:hypothetical protein